MQPCYPEPSSGFTKVKPTTIAGKIAQFPLVRLIIGLFFIVAAAFIRGAFQNLTKEFLSESYPDLVTVIDSVVGLALFLIIYWLYCRLIERRKPAELSIRGAIPEFVKGLGLALLLIGSALAMVLLLSDFTIDGGTGDELSLFVNFFKFADPSLAEEIFFRLMLFRLTEEWLGSWPAILIQALFFGFAHAGNPGATYWSSISIAVSAGGLLAAMYMYTRRIWMVWGVHLFWNYFQMAIMGLPVSGHTGNGIFQTSLTGSEWITGGSFGIEASVFVPLVCLVAGVIFLMWVIKAGNLVKPSWVRKKLELPQLRSE